MPTGGAVWAIGELKLIDPVRLDHSFSVIQLGLLLRDARDPIRVPGAGIPHYP